MPIKALQVQKQAQELGQLRFGDVVKTKDGKSHARSLSTWRITTRDLRLAEKVADYFNVTRPTEKVTLFDGSRTYDIRTGVDRLKALVPPGEAAIDQWMEMWSAAGCLRRCDGETETKSNEACKCPADLEKRLSMAANGKACKNTTRVRLLIPYLPGLGLWRLATGGYHAALELAGVTELLSEAAAQGIYLPVDVWLDERQKKVPGGLNKWVTPGLSVSETLETLTAIGAGEGGRTLQAVLGTGSNGVAAIEAPKQQPKPVTEPEVVEAKIVESEPVRSGPSYDSAVFDDVYPDDDDEIHDAEIIDEPGESRDELLAKLTAQRTKQQLSGPSWAKFAAPVLKRSVTPGENDFTVPEIKALLKALEERKKSAA